MLFDVVFSLDSVITAVGMANTLWVMASAIVIAVVIMLVASGLLADFVQRYPTVKMLALSFLMLIGMTLIADGAGFHVPKGYIYAAIGFSVGVEALNQLAARQRGSRVAARLAGFRLSSAVGAPPICETASLSAEEPQFASTGGDVAVLQIQLSLGREKATSRPSFGSAVSAGRDLAVSGCGTISALSDPRSGIR